MCTVEARTLGIDLCDVRTVLDGPGFAYAVFRPLWTGLGGQLEGGLRIGEVPGTARRLLVSESPSLGEVVQQRCDHALLRLEGKEYIVQDGDVAHFRFNV